MRFDAPSAIRSTVRNLTEIQDLGIVRATSRRNVKLYAVECGVGSTLFCNQLEGFWMVLGQGSKVHGGLWLSTSDDDEDSDFSMMARLAFANKNLNVRCKIIRQTPGTLESRLFDSEIGEVEVQIQRLRGGQVVLRWMRNKTMVGDPQYIVGDFRPAVYEVPDDFYLG